LIKKSLLLEAFLLCSIERLSLLIKYLIITSISVTPIIGNENIFHFNKQIILDDVENNGLYHVIISNLKTEVIIFGKPTSGSKVNVFYSKPDRNSSQSFKTNLEVFHDEKNDIVNIRNVKNDTIIKESKAIIILPQNIDLSIKNCMDKIFVKNITGTIQIDNQIGSIELDSINGFLDIKSSEAHTKINNSKIASNIDVKKYDINLVNILGNSNITSEAGDVFISGYNGNLFVFSKGGSLNLKNLVGEKINIRSFDDYISLKNAKANINIFNKLGDIKLSEIWGPLNAETHEGNIEIENYYGKLTLNSYSGNMSLNNIIGSTNISSNLSDIKIKLNYDSSYKDSYHSIQTLEGNIKIEIPKNLSMNLEPQLNSERTTQYITSDIPLDFLIKNNKIIGTKKNSEGTIPMVLFSKNGFISIKEF